MTASLIEAGTLNGGARTHLSDALTHIAEGYPNRRLNELMLWAYAGARDLEVVT